MLQRQFVTTNSDRATLPVYGEVTDAILRQRGESTHVMTKLSRRRHSLVNKPRAVARGQEFQQRQHRGLAAKVRGPVLDAEDAGSHRRIRSDFGVASCHGHPREDEAMRLARKYDSSPEAQKRSLVCRAL